MRSIVICTISIILSGCGAINPWYHKDYKSWEENKPPSDEHLVHESYMIGDVGKPEMSDPWLQLLNRQLEKSDPDKSSLVFLGDNLYYRGMPEEGDDERPEMERRMNVILDMISDFDGEIIFLPGNHDWNDADDGGWAAVIRQQEYIENYMNRGNIFLPDLGCPGPVAVELEDDLVLVVLDTEWWLHNHERPYGSSSYCEAKTEIDLLVQLDEILQQHNDKNIVLAAHHPLFSNSLHGGYFSIKEYIFPISIIRDEWYGYFPFVGIGSLYPLWRRFGGVNQDIPHDKYQKLITSMLSVLEKYDNVTYVAGHDHNLQHFKYEQLNHIISGSGAKKTYVEKRKGAIFTHAEHGYVKLKYYDNGEAWAEYWEATDDRPEGYVVFRTLLYAKPEEVKQQVKDLPSYKDSMITMPVSTNYDVSKFKQLWLGEHYRDIWSTPVTVPYLDIESFSGGLKPTRLGGGKQTITLRLINGEGEKYNIRSLDKDPSEVLPENLRTSLAQDLVQDQISAAHPYGAFIIPPLAKATGVLHTNPRLVYIPHDPRLKQYADDIGGIMAMIEEHPDDDVGDEPHFGYADNALGTDKVLEKIYKDNDNKVDQRNFLRSRILDMLIGDWDRHEDQYRWAEFEKEKGHVFKPIPEDRDQAFFKFDGILPWWVSKSWVAPYFQHFGYDFPNMKGLNYTAKTLDRLFLTELSRKDWIEIADSMQEQLTDEVIEDAARNWPDKIFYASGPEITAKLKCRRDKLTSAVMDYYEILAKEVSISGSDKYERFEIDRINRDSTILTIYKTSRKGEILKEIYNRTIFTDETKEVILYGLGGSDAFILKGQPKNKTLVRIIAGTGEDTVIDKTEGREARNFKVYTARKAKNVIYCIENCDVTTVHKQGMQVPKNIQVSYYNRREYNYDILMPKLKFEYNRDDGLFLGGGFKLKTFGFRKEPHATLQELTGAYSFRTGAYIIEYEGEFIETVGSWDITLDGIYRSPQFIRNFFGWGNETDFSNPLMINFEDPVDFYHVNMEKVEVRPALQNRVNELLALGFGPVYQHFDVSREFNFLFFNEGFADSAIFAPKHYGGLRFFGDLVAMDDEIVPKKGVRWNASLSLMQQLNDMDGNRFIHSESEAAAFVTPRFPFELTLGFRLGGEANFGEYEFFHAPTLGGRENLRGYRKTRFTGDYNMYGTFEPRLTLFDFNAYLFPGRFGISGHTDIGRVWLRGENSDKWHTGVGGGVWISIMQRTAVSVTYTAGEEERLFNAWLGFFF